jgi:hypothetical protein
MAASTQFSADDARRVGAEIGIDWDAAPFDVEQFEKGWKWSWATVSTTRPQT